MDINPNEDGINHINIYSKSKTELGRFLSNFYESKIDLGIDGIFNSVEGYWYWLSSHDDKLRTLSGFAAKKYGRSIKRFKSFSEDEFRLLIKRAIFRKIVSNPYFYKQLKNSTLPLKHYYTFNNVKCVDAGFSWIVEFIEKIRKNDELLFTIKIFNKDAIVKFGDEIFINNERYIFLGKEYTGKFSTNCIYIDDDCKVICKKVKSNN